MTSLQAQAQEQESSRGGAGCGDAQRHERPALHWAPGNAHATCHMRPWLPAAQAAGCAWQDSERPSSFLVEQVGRRTWHGHGMDMDKNMLHA